MICLNYNIYYYLITLLFMTVLCEAELRSAWERLGVGTGGYMHKNELAMVCSAVGMDTLADQVILLLHVITFYIHIKPSTNNL